MSKDIEIELKLPLHNAKEVSTFLSASAVFKYESLQHDVYYNAPHRDFLADKSNVSEWLRIRIEEGGAQINFKDFQPHEGRIKTHCKEYETHVESYDQLGKIFNALDFKKLVDVKKVRKAWAYKDTEICIDSVEELGEYIEVEYKGNDFDDMKAVRAHLHDVVEENWCEDRRTRTSRLPIPIACQEKATVAHPPNVTLNVGGILYNDLYEEVYNILRGSMVRRLQALQRLPRAA